MGKFKKHRRKQISELRPVEQSDIDRFKNHGFIHISEEPFGNNISISDEDKFSNNSPKIGDMIARNPNNHKDQWLVEKNYYEDNFERIEE